MHISMLRMIGGGGTSLKEVVKVLEDGRDSPDCVLLLQDVADPPLHSPCSGHSLVLTEHRQTFRFLSLKG